jgi:tetratricopeptide (TPR) repeat protein
LTRLRGTGEDRHAATRMTTASDHAHGGAGHGSGPEGLLVGREREREDLEAALEATIGGRGRLVLLSGEPGIGKTRLAGEFAADAGRRGVTVLRGRGWDGGGAPAYWCWVQVVRGYVRDAAPAELAREMGRGASLIAAIVPDLLEVLPELPAPVHHPDSEQARFRLFDAMAVFLGNASARRPLLLVLDDLHWADEPSLLLLQFLARGLVDTRILAVAAYRDTEARIVPHVARRVAALTADGHVLRLRRLEAPEVGRLVEAGGGVAADPLVGAIHAATNGNPLFVTEIIRLLAAEGRLEHADGRGPVPIPARVREVIRRHLGLLSEDGRRLLAVAAVLGRDFDPAALGQARELAGDRVLALLAEASRLGLVEDAPGPPGRFSFAHDLIRETLYDDLPSGERLALHGVLAEVLERRHAADPEPHLATLAHHFFHAARLDRATDYAVRAGDRAARQLAWEEAVVHYERALHGTTDERRRCDLWLALGDARWWAGRLVDSRAAFWNAATLARRLGAPAELARAAIGFGTRDPAYGIGVVDERLVHVLEEAVQAYPERDDPLRVMLLGRLAGALAFSEERDRGARLARDAVAMARRLGDVPMLHYALACSSYATWGPDNLEERLQVSAEIVRLGQEAGEAALLGSGFLATHLLEAGDVAGAERERQARSAHALRCRICAAWVAFRRASGAFLEGRYDEVEGLLRQARVALRELQHEHGEQHVIAQELLLRREQGRVAEMVDGVRDVAARHPALPVWRATLAWVHAETGREASARHELERLARADFADLPRDMHWLVCVAILAEVVAILADRPRAERLYAALAPYASRCITGLSVCLGSAARTLGVLAAALGRFADAARHFDDAITANGRLGARPWTAHAEYEYGRMLLARGEAGDRARARALLDRAATTARHLGMRALGARIEAALAGATAPAEAPAAPGPPVVSVVFRREGEYWTIAEGTTVARLRDAKGLRYLALLFGHPGREFYAGDLVGMARGGARPDLLGDAGPRLDDRSRDAYRARLAGLRETLAEAEANGDAGRIEAARTEIDFLARELSAAIGLGGRRRRAAAPAERARLVATKAIKASLAKIEQANPRLGRLLGRTVRTGTFCAYRPDPDTLVRWTF